MIVMIGTEYKPINQPQKTDWEGLLMPPVWFYTDCLMH